MRLRELTQLKRTKNSTSATVYKRYLFIGGDFYILNLLKYFLAKYPAEDIALVHSRKIEKENLMLLGPGLVRGRENISLWKKYFEDKFDNLGDVPTEVSALFYKDQNFRSFDGRHRSQTLMADEQFFLEKSLRGTSQSVEKYYVDSVSLEIMERLDLINEVLKKGQVLSINRTCNSDFISPINFEVQLASGELITCEHLFFAQAPYNYLELYKNKNDLSNLAIEFCEKSKAKHAILVRFYLAKKLSDKLETLYIPLSVSNELGHAVVEFSHGKGELVKNCLCEQYLDCYMSEDIEKADEESISRNIRLLRKNLERVFPFFEKNILNEYIVLSEQVGCQGIDDLLYWKAISDFKNICFVGENAPFERTEKKAEHLGDSRAQASRLVRAVLCAEQIQQLF